MSKQEKPNSDLTRRKFLAASGASLGVLAAGCRPKPEIPSKKIHDVEELLEFTYTKEEWEQLLINHENQLDQLKIVRKLNHPNSLAPAQRFDPRLPGVEYNLGETKFRITACEDDLPKNPEDIAFAPATHLSRWIQTKQITSLELTEIYLDRIQKLNSRLECFITVTSELARKQAREADAEIKTGHHRGPLHGLPYGLKDLFDTKGISTTWGATPYKDNIPDSDAHVVRKLREAGAVLLGKTSCGAIAMGDIWFGGVTRNPWDLREGSSGSSAGSASATAAGLVGFSIGTETLGSIISPSTRCGVTGLRPTFGRVGRTGGMTLCWSLDKAGALCRSVEDTAMVLQAINGFDSGDPSSIRTEFSYDSSVDLSELRVGFFSEFLTNGKDHPAFQTALGAVQASGAQMKEIQPPSSDHRPLILQLQVEAAAAFESLTTSNRDDEFRWQENEAWPNLWRKARLVSAIDYIQIDRLRRRLMNEMHDLFQDVDVIIGDNFGGGMLRISNFTGHPQLSLPCGFANRKIQPAFEETEVATGESGVFPYSIGIWGPLFREDNLIRVGRALEEQFDVNSRRPVL